jgi:hypothetical protein
LRGEVARLRQEQRNPIEVSAATNELPRWSPQQLTNAGKATPQDALRTLLWAANSGDVEETWRSIVRDFADRGVRDQNRTNFLVYGFSAGPPEFKVLSQRNIDQETVQVDVEQSVHPYRFVKTFTLKKLRDDEWRVVLFESSEPIQRTRIPYDLLGF